MGQLCRFILWRYSMFSKLMDAMFGCRHARYSFPITVEVASPETGEIKGWDKKDWGRPVKVDKALADVKASDYDAIVLPGGQINPDLLRVNKDALALIKSFFDAGKTIAAVCHAPWLLVEI